VRAKACGWDEWVFSWVFFNRPLQCCRAVGALVRQNLINAPRQTIVYLISMNIGLNCVTASVLVNSRVHRRSVDGNNLIQPRRRFHPRNNKHTLIGALAV
jgi:hypothetical protein